MDFNAIWDKTKAGLEDAYLDIVGFAIAAIEAAVLVLVASLVARWLKGRVRRTLTRSRLDPNAAALVVNGVAIATYIVAATFVMGLFGASWTALLALLSAGTLALTLAFQDVLKNVVAGMYLLIERPFFIGDRIRVKDVTGSVESIDFRTTVLRNEREERVLVPNATVFAEILVNRSAYDVGQTTFRLTNLVAPLVELRQSVNQALAETEGIRSPDPRVELTSVGETGAEATVSIWHSADSDVVPTAMSRLRERFPEATVTVEKG